MKRKSIYLAAALAALTMASCSNDEVMNDVPANGEGSAIAFTTTLDKAPVTRANTTTGANISKFRVVCYNDDNTHYFGPTEVTKAQGGSGWTYQGVHNWKHKDKPLRFFAVHGTTNAYFKEPTVADPSPAGNNFPFIKDFPIHPGYFMDANGNYVDGNGQAYTEAHPQHDLCAAFYEGKEANGAVRLNFKHLLSKIEVQAKNGLHDANGTRKVEVMGVRLVNLTKSGTWVYNVGDAPSTQPNQQFNGTWSHATTGGGDFCIRLHPGATPVTLNTGYQPILPKDESFMVFPTRATTAWGSTQDNGAIKTGTYLSVICRVTIKDAAGNVKVIVPNTGNADRYGMAMIPISFNLEQGKKYTFRLDFTNGSGQVDPTIPSEPDGGDIDEPDHGHGDDYEGGQISFNVTVEDWADAGNTDKEM